jgi:TM2 domain-containing membrane protein YozV
MSTYFSTENVLKFADYLYLNGDYLRAAGEYQRYLFSSDFPINSDSVYYRMIKAVFLGRDYQKCDRLLTAFDGKYPGSVFAGDISLYRSVVKYREHDYKNSLTLAQTSNSENTQLRRCVLTLNYLYLHDFKSAEKCACAPDETNSLPTVEVITRPALLSGRVCEKSRAANSLPVKSPLKAGFYSALVPGAGKIYCGKIADGVYSFLITGLSIWQAYDGFAEHGVNSGKGWVFAVLGGGFYLGNVYGSVIAAKFHNRDTRADFLNGLEIELTLP